MSRRRARPPLATPALLALIASTWPLAAACVGPGTGPDDSQRPARTRATAADLAPTQTFEIRFGSELAGYLIDVLPAEPGQPDTRAYEPGTAVIQSLDHTLLGFISPHGTTYRFDEAGEAQTVAFGSRSTSITAFFRKNDPPALTPIKR
jgi:hypothetical protein